MQHSISLHAEKRASHIVPQKFVTPGDACPSSNQIELFGVHKTYYIKLNFHFWTSHIHHSFSLDIEKRASHMVTQKYGTPGDVWPRGNQIGLFWVYETYFMKKNFHFLTSHMQLSISLHAEKRGCQWWLSTSTSCSKSTMWHRWFIAQAQWNWIMVQLPAFCSSFQNLRNKCDTICQPRWHGSRLPERAIRENKNVNTKNLCPLYLHASSLKLILTGLIKSLTAIAESTFA